MACNSREDFVNMMIAEMERQHGNDIDSPSFSLPHQLTPLQVWQKLNYDFPEISGEDLRLLASAIESLATQATVKDQAFMESFSLSAKFIENLDFLSSNPPNSFDSHEELGLLCSSVYYILPSYLLRCDEPGLRRCLCYDENGTVLELMSPQPPPVANVSKSAENQIVSSFLSFMNRANASFLGGLKLSTIQSSNYLGHICETIRILDVDSSESVPSWLREKILYEGSESEDTGTLLKTLWVKSILLYRDIVCQHVELIPHDLSSLFALVLQNSPPDLFTPGFPSARGCLMVLLYSSVAASMTPNMDKWSNRLGSSWNKSAEALIVANKLHFDAAVAIMERMAKHGDIDETINFACEIGQFIVFCGMQTELNLKIKLSCGPVHEIMLKNRIVQLVLIHSIEKISLKKEDSLSTNLTFLSTACLLHPEIAVFVASYPDTSRVIQDIFVELENGNESYFVHLLMTTPFFPLIFALYSSSGKDSLKKLVLASINNYRSSMQQIQKVLTMELTAMDKGEADKEVNEEPANGTPKDGSHSLAIKKMVRLISGITSCLDHLGLTNILNTALDAQIRGQFWAWTEELLGTASSVSAESFGGGQKNQF